MWWINVFGNTIMEITVGNGKCYYLCCYYAFEHVSTDETRNTRNCDLGIIECFLSGVRNLIKLKNEEQQKRNSD
jgi:hypothetical protein